MLAPYQPTPEIHVLPTAVPVPGAGVLTVNDTPWARIVDEERFGRILDDVRRLQPSRILASHLPAAGGHRVERFLQLLGGLRHAEPFVAPDHEAFDRMVAAMAALIGEH